MRPKLRIISALLILSLVAFVDHQYFYEPERAAAINPMLRQLVHLLVLLIFIPIGRWALTHQLASWLKGVWTLAYLVLPGILMTAGFLQWRFQLFPVSFLDFLSGLRTFFTSPLPLAILFYLGSFSGSREGTVPERP